MALPKTMPISTLASRKWTNAVMKWYWNEPMNWTCSTSPSWSTWTCHFHWGGLLVQLFGPSWGLNRAMALQSRRWCNRRLQNEDHQGFKQHGTITEDHGKEDTHVFQIEVATVTVSGVNENLFNSEYTALEETPKQNTHHSLRFNHREGTAGSFKRPSFAKIPLQLSLPFTTSTFQPCSGLPNSLKCWCPILQESTGMAAIILQPICNCITMSYSLLIWYVHICSTTRANWPTYIAQFEECC